MSDGMRDAYRLGTKSRQKMEEEAKERENALEKDGDFDTGIEGAVRTLSRACLEYLGIRESHAALLVSPFYSDEDKVGSKKHLSYNRDVLASLCEGTAGKLRKGKL